MNLKLIFLILLIAQTTWAGFDRFGYELELTPRQYANIIDWYEIDLNKAVRGLLIEYFDVIIQPKTEKLKKNKLHYEFAANLLTALDDYIENPDALSSLPPEVKSELLKDLDMNVRIDAVKDLNNIQVPDQPEKYEKKGLIWLPKSNPNDQAVANFAELKRRWLHIPIKKRLELLDLNLLSRYTRALTVYFAKANFSADFALRGIQIKAGAPQILRELSFVTDGDSIEFRPTDPIVGFDNFMAHIKAFCHMTGIYSQVFDTGQPEKLKNNDVSLHVHISKLQRDNLTFLADKLNFLLLVRNLKRGDYSDLVKEKLHAYNLDLKFRGRMRLIENNHIEIRLFIDDLESEMGFYNSLTDVEEARALDLVDNRLKSLVTKDMAEKVFSSSRWQVSPLFLEYINEHDRAEFAERIYQRYLTADRDKQILIYSAVTKVGQASADLRSKILNYLIVSDRGEYSEEAKLLGFGRNPGEVHVGFGEAHILTLLDAISQISSKRIINYLWIIEYLVEQNKIYESSYLRMLDILNKIELQYHAGTQFHQETLFIKESLMEKKRLSGRPWCGNLF